MSDLICVRTCPRPTGISYLAETLAALDGAGALDHREKIIISDGPLDMTDEMLETLDRGWLHIVHPDGPSGTKQGLWKAFRTCLNFGEGRSHDRIHMFEDDIVPCKNAVKRVLQHPIPNDVAFISWFDYREFEKHPEGGTNGMPRKRLWTRATNSFWGIQALTFPRETIEFLANIDPEMAVRRLRGNPHNSDMIMAEILTLHPSWPKKNLGLHFPCLFEHVGDQSAWNPDPATFIRATDWRGKDFDALTLPIYE